MKKNKKPMGVKCNAIHTSTTMQLFQMFIWKDGQISRIVGMQLEIFNLNME